MKRESRALAPPDFAPELRLAAERLPKPVRFRMLNALNHSDAALKLLAIDREMASFQAITGEEEGAAALIRAIQLRDYPHASRLSIRDHQHKAAFIPFIAGVRNHFARGFSKLNVTLDYAKPRIDVHIPLSELGVELSDKTLGLQPVEPLDIRSMKPGPDGTEIPHTFAKELSEIAKGANYEGIKEFVKSQANSRNRLLYASDSALPKSKTTEAVLIARRRNVLVMLGLTVIVMQTRTHQALVSRGIEVLLEILDRLPSPDET